MSISSIFIFSIALFVTWGMYLVLGKKYALDQPDSRKQHHHPVPQIGGLVFGPLFLLLVFWLELAPVWYLITGLVTIILGLADDRYHVPWKFKLLVQLILVAYLSFLFWGRFDTIVFYNVSIPISPLILLAVFIIWFVGIYNAVNLLDDLDGDSVGLSENILKMSKMSSFDLKQIGENSYNCYKKYFDRKMPILIKLFLITP